MKGRTPGLGRGMAALFEDRHITKDTVRKEEPHISQSREILPIHALHPNPHQPRRYFDPESLAELVSSIKTYGIIQPIIVRNVEKEYEIIAGERRWRAGLIAELEYVPVVIWNVTPDKSFELALVENIQRENLTPLEESESYRQLIHQFQYTHNDLGQIVGKSRSYISNMLRLLDLPDSVRALLASKELTAGHARALLGMEDSEQVAQQIVEQGLSVRQVEQMSREASSGQAKKQKSKKKSSATEKEDFSVQTEDMQEVADLEKKLSQKLNVKVVIEQHNMSNVELRIVHGNLHKLDDLIQHLMRL